ncbi:DUF488 family protein [Nonomuraea roseoviolacea]|uniref:Uncharacterized protein (DUF488 family) n=1 Tax=Nonomuraea roseoviolacea subsp. carminata TaxID=160689 RepID=A0ABT1JQY3_9ACTN|nr:DUF488 domain-containing protein [Nonomuraea roseoviolacea]MCP2343975.1 uncharacterized protein (DUF488 family) [Nonomuraea roseoviolacea subsp. carminata]
MSLDQRTAVIGVGYEGNDLDAFLRQLRSHGVSCLIDVRLTPISRKPGFSKRRLSESLTQQGIDYIHLPQLGNPKWNRLGFAGSAAELAEARTNYETHIASAEAVAALDEIALWAQKGRVALLCFEADERRCHRSVILELIRRHMSQVA